MELIEIACYLTWAALTVVWKRPNSPKWAKWRRLILSLGGGAVASFAMALLCYGWLDHRVVGDVAMFSAAFLLFGYLTGGGIYAAFHTSIR